jgi:hypothetical protein
VRSQASDEHSDESYASDDDVDSLCQFQEASDMATMDAYEKKIHGNDMIFCCDWDVPRHETECKRKTKMQEKASCQDTAQTHQFDIDSIMFTSPHSKQTIEAANETYAPVLKKLRLS